VDQDDHDPTPIRIPVRSGSGRLRAATWQSIDAKSGVAKGVPTGAIPAQSPQPLPKEVTDGYAAIDSVATGLARMRQLLTQHAGAASLARQFATAAGDACGAIAPSVPGTTSILYAVELARTDLFAWLISRMIADPLRCTQTYNDAAKAFPEAGIAPLRVDAGSDGSRVELPLWKLDLGASSPTQAPHERASSPGQRTVSSSQTILLAPDGRGTSTLPARLRVTANMLATLPRQQLAPRALLMTAMLRLGACDLFIHGTGGGAYDRVTDRWIKEWLGESLAPTAVVTATMYLPLGGQPAQAAEAARAQWFAHHARHDPALLGDEPAAREKVALVEEVRAGKRQGQDTKGAYRALHALLARVREEHAESLRTLDAQAEQARSRLADADVVGDRTWAFPLFDAADLIRLRDEIDQRFAGPAKD
ncbi:MAG: hypothetical protein H7210_11250, partial [Pyrinomonadaceae bacterium]|nr:hypothetical protein [Phycisphaerales bacterium]